MSYLSSIGARVGIVGRPNVGKSTLFNILTRTRKAVVKNQPGVTRDVLVETAEWWGKQFDVIDTGGITESRDLISGLIREQVVSVLENLDMLVLVMDGKGGLIPEDREVVRIAKESGKPCVLVVNKIDKILETDLVLSEFYEFGLDVIGASFERRSGVDEVVEWIIGQTPDINIEKKEGLRVCVVGKPNVGKSSLCNHLLGEKRMLVSDMAGTTVDSVEAPFSYNDKDYIFVDTAGLRRQAKRNKTDDGVEILSAYKSHEAIDRSDIVLLLVDATMGPTDQDAKMVEYILEQHKAVIMVANKADVAKAEIEEHRKTFRAQVEKQFHFFKDIPIVFTCALTGYGVKNLFQMVDTIWDKLRLRISTSKLNKFFYETIRQAPAPVWGTKNVKFYYLTQTNQRPPSFIAFANHPQGVTPSYRRFLTNRIKKQWSLEEVPVRMFVMKSGK